jgi:hypothetical protein
MLFTAILLFAAADSNAQIYVRVRPHHPGPAVVVRGARPSPRHVWIGEEWTPNGRDYNYRPGFWGVPPTGRAIWVPGHWANRPRGYVWVPGHWRR